MEPRLKVITLGVADLEAALVFYRDGLGLPTPGIIGTEFEDGAVVFIELNDGLILALYPRESLAREARVDAGPPGAAAFTLGHNVASREAVDAVMAQAKAAGARITDPARDRFWGGYAGHFQDLDGHLWEIAWNPAWDAEDEPRGGPDESAALQTRQTGSTGLTSIEPARYAEGRAMRVAGLRRHHTFADAPATIAAQWAAFNALGPIPGRRGGKAYGVMCGTVLAEQRFEYMAGVEVDSFDALPAELGRMRVPVQQYAVFEHAGHVSTLWQTWGLIWQDWVPRSGRTPADTPDFELYGEDFDPATGLATMEIWFPLAPA